MWDLNLMLFHVINGVAGHHAIDVMISSTENNSLIRVAILTSPYAYIWHQTRDESVKGSLIAGLIGVLFSIINARALAHVLPFELRPFYDPTSGFKHLSVADNPDLESWSAFPSDTAAVCCALPFGLYWCCRRAALILIPLSLLVFVIPRIYLGIHYPFDVMVGSLIGILCALVAQTVRRSRPIHFMLSIEQAKPGLFHFWFLIALSESALMFGGLRALFKMVRNLN